ncbi:MAG: DUF1778 domain-containing protein [Gammaproteobacteria bacterium]|nr:DUF1778 domain-containing protein [Gammaproteobacteria bacterium]
MTFSRETGDVERNEPTSHIGFIPEMYAKMTREFTDKRDRMVAGTGETEHDRMHLRPDAKSKQNLERAAAHEETTVSRFVLSNAVAAVERMIEARERFSLPSDD